MIETIPKVAIMCFVLGTVIWVIWTLFAIVGDMAERRGQDRLIWQVAAFFLNPFLAMILLWLFCDIDEHGFHD